MQPLSRLLRPRSIAVVGGGAWCANVIAECRKIGFAGPVWPVHATKREIAGLPAFASVADLPGAPDAAFVGVNRGATVEVVRALAERGAGGAVCFASGFRESKSETGDGDTLEAALVAAAGSMRILGPNCYGFLNLLDGAALWPDQHGGLRTGRGVALVTQSSNIAINLTMQTRGLPVAYVVTAGNQAQTGLAEIAAAVLADDRVTALGLHVEGIGDLGAFAAMARAAGKPIVAIKAGASEQSRVAAVSHTGSLAGSAAGARALFDRLGVAQVETLAELLETLKLLHVAGPLAGTRLASMSCSGGEAGLMADAAARTGLVCPPLVPTQAAALRAALGPKVALANPLDYHTYIWGDRAAITATFTAMMAGPVDIGAVVLDFPRPDRCDGAAWEIVVDAVADTAAAAGKPMAILSSLPETMPEPAAQAMVARGIVPLCGMAEGLAAIAAAGRARPGRAGALLVPGPEPRAVRLLTEAEGKAVLAAHGVPVPRRAEAASAGEAAARAAEIGFPVVLKALGVAHKTEAGAVALGLADADAVEAAATRMGGAAFLVEEMVTGAVAEVLVGILRDPAHGFVLTLGAGGVMAEILGDTLSLSVPATASEIEAALAGLRCGPLLSGYRGRPSADMPALVAAILSVQDCAVAHAGALMELEINPLIATPDRAVAVDALIRLGDTP
ncbi:acetate--CoA ligase family protein [Roseicyclus persicicus]|uniref:Acetate--CoA ligase family protein n=1 Tax=Roseicyclus persicicus TaxID=2650661 RepID=A0A7X6H2R1_9RHOB|nr:acetate--CoA ligase family protein [Roseibacterium persicicum]NKX45682.1 acetate--CoA ligase family protein [Roseibacterium persicicum]